MTLTCLQKGLTDNNETMFDAETLVSADFQPATKTMLSSLLNLGSLLKYPALTDKASKEEGEHYATVD